MPVPDYRFNGPEYQPTRDNPRLDSQLERVKALMIDGRWRTLETIASTTGDPVASVSAQLRHLRKERFGNYRVERRHVGAGLFEYRVLEPLPPEPVVPPPAHQPRLALFDED
jgi:hypothetical protein